MEISKSSRHSKITGDFGEALVLYWLSKHGFECARIDRTGIDLIARNPHTSEVMGISVKGRSRNPGKEDTTVRIAKKIYKKLRKLVSHLIVCLTLQLLWMQQTAFVFL